jgi:hypothetical protein
LIDPAPEHHPVGPRRAGLERIAFAGESLQVARRGRPFSLMAQPAVNPRAFLAAGTRRPSQTSPNARTAWRALRPLNLGAQAW